METREICDFIFENKIIAIARNIRSACICETVEALLKGGIKAVEVALNQTDPQKYEDCVRSIQTLSDRYPSQMVVGAGTVLTEKQVEDVVSVGAKYIISPNISSTVIKRTKELNCVSIPGALTPSEMVDGRNYGADIIKIFPSSVLGPAYIKALMSPLKHIPVLAVGGINENNLKSYLDAGASGAGIGDNLVNAKLIEAGEYEKITELARKYTNLLL